MNAARQSFLLFFTLMALASSGWYFASTSPKFSLDEHTLWTTTDTLIHQVTLEQYDKSGKLANALSAPLLRHIPQNNTHWIKQPHITIKQANKPAWDITALEATALYGGEKITFSKQVVMHQNQENKTQDSTFTTDEITYFPKQKLAITEKPVTFEQPGNKIQSTGMRAELESKHIQLLSQARGVYDPKQG